MSHSNSALLRTSGKGLEILERSNKFSVEHGGASNRKVINFLLKLVLKFTRHTTEVMYTLLQLSLRMRLG
jgi:hypothetical protein